MSINITVHGKPASVINEKHLLFNPELAKKIESEQRKKLRLEQVREQSKEFASQIRNRVNEERKRQQNKYEDTRTKELKQWQKGKLEKAQDAYSAAISSVGDAHTAALNEENITAIREANKVKNDLIAAQRGREAAANLRKREHINLPKKSFIAKEFKNKIPKDHGNFENKRNKSPAAKKTISKVKTLVKQTSPSRIEKTVINKHMYPDVEIEHVVDTSSDTEISVLKSRGPFQKLTKELEKSDDSDSYLDNFTITSDEEDVFIIKGKIDKTSPKKLIQPLVTKKVYNPNDYRAKSTSPESLHSPVIQAASIKPFTQVSDLLQRRSRKVSRETSDNVDNSADNKQYNDNKINLEKPIIDSKKKVEIDEVIKSPKKTVIKMSSPKKSDVPKVIKDTLISSNSNNNKKNVIDNSKNIESNKQSQNQYHKHTIKSQIENINPNEQQSKVNTRLIVKKPPFVSSTKTTNSFNDSSNKKLSSVDRYSHSSKNESGKTDTNKSESKVQYYDHENRFTKEYVAPESFVTRNESINDAKNAMEEAEIFIEAQKLRSQHMEDLRKRESIRSIKALEKVEMRKEYDLLTSQLDDLAKKENLTKNIMNYKNIDEITRKMANERQKKLNEAFKKIGHQPVIITTPEIREEIPNYSGSRLNSKVSAELNVAADMGQIDDTHEEIINSSDSCASILLGYVNNQSAEISQQINKLQSTSPLNDNNNINKLRDLLIRINKQKSLLLHELKNNESVPAKSVSKVLESLKNIDREKDLIVMLDPKRNNKNETKANEKELKLKNDLIALEKREKLLKEKEQQIDKKMLQLYESEKKQKKLDEIENHIKRINVNQLKTTRNIEIETDNGSQNQVEVIEESCTSNDQDNVNNGPIKIIIKVNDKLRRKTCKSPKRRCLHKKTLEKISKSPGKCFPKTPKRKTCSDKSESIEVMKNKLLKSTAEILKIPHCASTLLNAPPPTAKSTSEMSMTSASTQYRSPPDKLKTTLSQFLFKQKMENDGKFIKWGEMNQIRAGQINVPGNKNLNPSLVHYITRLLGMSRQSIDQLGVSTSTDVSTPSESVINVTGNISMDSSTDNRMERLKKFIDENYNFLSDLEESLKEQNVSDSYEEKMKEIEKIWMIMLKKKEKEMEAAKLRKKNEEMKKIEKKLKPVLKNWKKSNIVTVEKESSSSSNNVEADPLQKNIQIKDAAKNIITLADEIDDEIAQKYNKMTETCNQRIQDLAAMIEKVRQEKHRLLESSNFSGSDQIEQSTEYMDFVQRNVGSVHSGDTSRIELNNRDELIHDAVGVNRLEGNRHIGLSKDSGISISRPLTATEMRDSPEVRQDGTREYEPLLKDIPKVFYSRRLNEENNENNMIKERSDDVLSISPNDIFASRKYVGEITSNMGNVNVQSYKDIHMQKRQKPVSTRYSPIMDQAPIHELSTIIEVDTPAPSKMNTSIFPDDQSFGQDNNKTTQTNGSERNYSLEITNKSEVLSHEKFLSYEEYVKQQKLDKSQYTINTDLSNKIIVEKLLEEEIAELEYRRFPTRREYNQAQGITDHVDSQCINSIDEDKLDIDSKNSSSNSSLPDVVAELKRRNILQESFHNEVNSSNRSGRVSEALNRILMKDNITPENETDNKKIPNSPRKKQSEQRTGLRTPQKKPEEKSKSQHTPTKNKPQIVARSPKKNSTKNNDMSGFDILQKSSDSGKQLEQELSNMGLNWAATMMKKIQESHTISSTSDSSTQHNIPKRKSPKKKSNNDLKDNAAVKSLLDSNIAREALKVKEKAENEDSGSDESLSETKPLNLKEFLARELMRRTNTDVQTSTNDDSSSLMSQFLRSFMHTSLNATPLNTGTKNGQLRTSTPVFTKSASTSQDEKRNASSGLFSGVSRISSVRFSSSEPSNSNSLEKKTDSLKVPNLKLNIDKYKQSTSNESSNSSP